MKRSEINAAIRQMEDMSARLGFALPPFTRWTPEEWNDKGAEYAELRDNMLGWDITDFGKGHFDTLGLTLLTIRNGNQKDARYVKPYAEKLLMSQEDQITPMHFHWYKMEDIINRGGGNLLVQVYNATEDEAGLADTDVAVMSDGRCYTVKAGAIIRLTPGESITIPSLLYHKFWAEKGHGPVLVGEVSKCNDDKTDNRFYESLPRFPSIVEDEPPYRLLYTEYPAAPQE